MKIARVFPTKTKATPTDELAFFGYPDPEKEVEADEVHVSVAFTGDIQRGEWLAEVWNKTGLPVRIGGPAYKQPAGEFIPGLYLKEGYTITSRGCPNKCWFCDVNKVQPEQIELPIRDGWIVQDDNLLACSEQHIKAVFEMLKRQPQRAQFSGGLEAKLLKPWHVELLRAINPVEIFFAYDTPSDLEPLIRAGEMLKAAGYTVRGRKLYCYVLAGFPGDTFTAAEKRCKQALEAGFIPFTMLYMHKSGYQNPDWKTFQRLWSRPALIWALNKEYFKAQR